MAGEGELVARELGRVRVVVALALRLAGLRRRHFLLEEAFDCRIGFIARDIRGSDARGHRALPQELAHRRRLRRSVGCRIDRDAVYGDRHPCTPVGFHLRRVRTIW